MNFEQLADIVINTHLQLQQNAVKAVNQYQTIRNWLIGFYIVEFEQDGEDRALYGTQLLINLEHKVNQRGLNITLFQRARTFYAIYPQFAELIRHSFESICATALPKLLEQREQDLIKEKELETLLLDNLREFILEMGNGFCFEARQKRILIGDEFYFIDMVFYHRILKLHCLIELKVDSFNHAHVSQLYSYLNYYKAEMMEPGDNPPIGILLVTDKNDTLVQYATSGLDEQVFVSKYKLQLPTEKQLKELILKNIQN